MDNLKETEKLSLIQSYEYLKSRKKLNVRLTSKKISSSKIKDIFLKIFESKLQNSRLNRRRIVIKGKKKLPLQNFHQQILIKFFDIERMYTFLVLELSQ